MNEVEDVINWMLVAYIRSKQKACDKIGPLKHKSSELSTAAFEMAQDFNEQFSSLFSRE